jgi:hypothetical protein
VAGISRFRQNLYGKLSAGGSGDDFGAKKGGTNGEAVRAGRPVTQTTSSLGWRYTLPPPQLEYIHHSIDSEESKYNNRNFLN